MHHRICRSTASRSPVLTRGGICVPPTVTYLPYRVSGSTLTAVGRSHCWPDGLELTPGFSSALGVLNDYTLYKSTQSLTHSLTQIISDAIRLAVSVCILLEPECPAKFSQPLVDRQLLSEKRSRCFREDRGRLLTEVRPVEPGLSGFLIRSPNNLYQLLS